MDVKNFIPCLIKTATNYAEKARKHFEKMDFLTESLCPNGEHYYIHCLYGTSVEFRYDDFFINALEEKPSGITILVSFEMHGFQHNIHISSLDDSEKVKEKIYHYFYVRAMNVNRYLDELETIREFLRLKIN